MNRRSFLASAAALALIPAAARAAQTIPYAPGVIENALADGKTVFVEFAAKWCSTCRRQERAITALRAEDPAYDAAMVFVKVDWDEYRSHEVTVSRKVPRRSTLLVLRGEEELGRLVAVTGTEDIKALMDKGLASAES